MSSSGISLVGSSYTSPDTMGKVPRTLKLTPSSDLHQVVYPSRQDKGRHSQRFPDGCAGVTALAKSSGKHLHPSAVSRGGLALHFGRFDRRRPTGHGWGKKHTQQPRAQLE
jgi:hypothetical protein